MDPVQVVVVKDGKHHHITTSWDRLMGLLDELTQEDEAMFQREQMLDEGRCFRHQKGGEYYLLNIDLHSDEVTYVGAATGLEHSRSLHEFFGTRNGQPRFQRVEAAETVAEIDLIQQLAAQMDANTLLNERLVALVNENHTLTEELQKYTSQVA